MKETSVTPEDLFDASEVFLTGTTAGVWPVESVDDHKLLAPPPGPVATQLGKRFRKITAGEDPDPYFASWLALVNPQ